ncbi:MAG: twin-arginine translocase subunit TatC [Thiohalospira sp.]
MAKDTDKIDPDAIVAEEQPFLTHLFELRDRLLKIVLTVALIFLALFTFANEIYSFVAAPLLAHLPADTGMIATEVASPFLTPFKLTLFVALLLAIPVILHQIWAFIAPGLYSHERRLAMPLLTFSVLLFYLGMVFAYYAVMPLVFGFFTATAPEGVAVMTDIARYLDFVLKLFFAFGIAFEVPIVTILLVWAGITTPKTLASKRPYVIVGAFVIGMVLTPPDAISQTLLAVPMWLLFELGLLLSRFFVGNRGTEGEDDDGGPDDDGPSGGTTGEGGPSGDGDEGPSGGGTGGDTAEDAWQPLDDEAMEAELDRAAAEEESLRRSRRDDSGTAAEPSAAPDPEDETGQRGTDDPEPRRD